MAKWNATINNRLLIHKHRLASLLKNLKNTKNAGYMVVFNGFDHLLPPKEDFKYILSYFLTLGCLYIWSTPTAQLPSTTAHQVTCWRQWAIPTPTWASTPASNSRNSRIFPRPYQQTFVSHNIPFDDYEGNLHLWQVGYAPKVCW